MILRAAVLAALVGSVPVSAAADPVDAATARAKTVACPFDVPAGIDASCRRVARPLGGGGSANLEVELFVLVVEGRGPGAAAPLVYLDGGPGGTSFLRADEVAVWWQAIEDNPFLATRDLVVVAQRGTAPSRPDIDCPAFKTAAEAVLRAGLAARGTPADRRLDALAGCAAALRARGIELDAFATPWRAADVPAVLRALGYDAWHLWGVSYGTHLALSVLRDHPDGVRSVVLDSVMAPDLPADLVADGAARWRQRLFDLCAADAACAARYPDLDETFARVVARLDADPLEWTEDPDDADALAMPMDGATVREAIEVLTYDTWASRDVPAALAEADSGAFDRLAGLVGALVWYEREDGMASLALDARWCAELHGAIDPALAPVSDIHDLKHAAVPDADTWCASIGVEPLAAAARAPAASDVPVLLLVGAEDLVTPPAWAHAAARHLGRSTLVAFPGYGHAVTFADDCPMAVMAAFLDDPASAEATACLATLEPPAFTIVP